MKYGTMFKYWWMNPFSEPIDNVMDSTHAQRIAGR